MDTVLPDLTEEDVAALVDRFYARVRADERLGAIFSGAIKDWDAHLGVMRDFWSAALRGTDRYRGCVMSPHFGLPMKASDLDRFLELFRPTAREALPPASAERAIAVADSVIQVLRRAVQ